MSCHLWTLTPSPLREHNWNLRCKETSITKMKKNKSAWEGIEKRQHNTVQKDKIDGKNKFK